jgi:hypothetical protein
MDWGEITLDAMRASNMYTPRAARDVGGQAAGQREGAGHKAPGQ